MPRSQLVASYWTLTLAVTLLLAGCAIAGLADWPEVLLSLALALLGGAALGFATTRRDT